MPTLIEFEQPSDIVGYIELELVEGYVFTSQASVKRTFITPYPKEVQENRIKIRTTCTNMPRGKMRLGKQMREQC